MRTYDGHLGLIIVSQKKKTLGYNINHFWCLLDLYGQNLATNQVCIVTYHSSHIRHHILHALQISSIGP